MNRVVHTIVIGVTAALATAWSQPKETKLSAFSLEQEVVLAGTPTEVYDAVTGDISPWWDHHFTATPKKFYIEAKPGGGFYEIFNDAGDGLRHGTVIWLSEASACGSPARWPSPASTPNSSPHTI